MKLILIFSAFITTSAFASSSVCIIKRYNMTQTIETICDGKASQRVIKKDEDINEQTTLVLKNYSEQGYSIVGTVGSNIFNTEFILHRH